MAWAAGLPAAPIAARTWTAYSIEYTFADGTKALVTGRYIPNCDTDFATFVHGTKCAAKFSGQHPCADFAGICKDQHIEQSNIAWRAPKETVNPWQAEWDVLLSAIRNDRPHNEARRAALSNLGAIMGRAAVHSGKIITWEQAMASDFQFCPNVDELTEKQPGPGPGGCPGPIPSADARQDRRDLDKQSNLTATDVRRIGAHEKARYYADELWLGKKRQRTAALQKLAHLPTRPAHMRNSPSLLAAILCAMLLAGCRTPSHAPVQQLYGESLVFFGDTPATLAHLPIARKPLAVRSTYLPAGNTVNYVAGRDYAVDSSQGTIRRLAGSRIPDFQTNLLYGQQDFDHTKFPGFGNAGFLAFVDYSFIPRAPWPIELPQIQFLKATQAKLREGKPVKIVAFGDSITAGGDATTPGLIFWMRWVESLQRKYPQAQITAINGATGGDSTVQGLQRLEAKVLAEKPDLVLVGFGMNDHNVNGVPIPQFEANLKQIVARIRNEAGAEVILFSAFPPNPQWKFGSHRMEEYETATYRVAHDMSCAFADVFNNWQALAARKKPEDLLGNNINHPNDFGHWIYFRVFERLGL